MSQRERIVIGVGIAIVAVWLLALSVITAGELRSLNADLTMERIEASSEEPVATPERNPVPKNDPPIAIGVAGAEVLSDTMTMTVTVRYAGQGDLLYEPPQVVDAAGNTYPITGESLREAHFAFLDLVTAGQVTAQLTFAGAPPPRERLTLVFNPDQPPGNAYVAPRAEANIPNPNE